MIEIAGIANSSCHRPTKMIDSSLSTMILYLCSDANPTYNHEPVGLMYAYQLGQLYVGFLHFNML